MESRRSAIRVEFSKEHDTYLYKYLAMYCPSQEGRRGQRIFQRLVANENNTWPWSVHHTWQSWRERYVKNTDRFDALILNYQRKHNIKSTERSKRAAEPIPIEMLGPSAKRVKLEKAPINKTCTEQGAAAQHAISRSSKSKLISKGPREPQGAPNSQAHCQPKPRLTDVRPSSIPHPNNDTNTDATKKPSLDLPALQTRDETLEIPSSSLNQPVPITVDGEPEPRSSPRAVKQIQKRHRTPSEVFASEPSSPSRDPAVVNVWSAPVTDTIYPRAPPRVVDSLHGQTLVNQRGYVPRAFPHGEEDGAEEEKEQEGNARWPPPRGHTAKQRTVGGPGNEVDTHHPFSQTQPQSRPEASQEGMAVAKREQGKPHHLFRQVARRLDQCTVATLFSAGLSHGVAPRVTGERREDIIRNGTSPVKRIIPTAPASALLSSLIPNPVSKAFNFPAPRASTRSPFRPEPPAGETHHPAPRPQSRTQVARHPAPIHIRRQTIDGNANGNGHERENVRGREHGQVPSVDLVALSRSSMSARSHSRSSTDTSIPGRPSRWSLPSFARATPWVTDEPEGALLAPGAMLGSSSSPFRWVAPSPVYADILGLARTSSLGGTSSPQLMFTPSPARSISTVPTDTNPSAPLPNPNPTSSPISISPHPPDVLLAAAHGLASILAHMSANHGLALNVVEAVYTRVGSLREADEVLMGMRKAAEGFGEREIEKKTRGRHKVLQRSRETHEGKHGQGGDRDGDRKEQKRTALRYVVASEDGEGSEYSPPWTSRAAMWKQQSESASYVEEEEDTDDEEEEEGRVVEEQLLEEDRAGETDDHHDFSQAFMEDMRAREVERQMGKAKFRREIVKQFL